MIHRFIARGEGTLEARPDGNFMQYCDHAAFVAQVREVAEGMECARDCESTLKAWETNLARCTCPRGKLLALCEVD